MANKDNLDNVASLQEELKYTKVYQKKDKKINTANATMKARKLILSKYKHYIERRDKISQAGTDTIMIGVMNKTIEYIETLVTNSNILSTLEKDEESKLDLVTNYSPDSLKDLKKKIRSFEAIANNKIVMKKELADKEEKYIVVTQQLEEHKKDPSPSNAYARKLRKLEIQHTKLRIRIKDLKEFIKVESISNKLYLSDEPELTAMGWAKLLLSYAFLLFWVLVIIWPIYELIKATFNDASTSYLDASQFKFGTSSYSRLFNDTDYTQWLINTLIISVATSVVTVAFTLLMGYAFSRFRFKGKKASLLSIMLLQMIPTLAALTVFYVLFTLLHQSLKMSGAVVLSIIYIGGGIAGNTFIMKGYMDSISMEIDEAAKIDGLSQWKIFTRIIAPLTKPMIALVALWSFIGPFGDYVLPGLLLSDSKDYTLAKGLHTLGRDQHNIDQPAYAAGAVITALPISILFISLRKFLVGGITAGGVKG